MAPRNGRDPCAVGETENLQEPGETLPRAETIRRHGRVVDQGLGLGAPFGVPTCR